MAALQAQVSSAKKQTTAGGGLMTRPSSTPGITHEFGQRPPGQEPPRVLPPDKGKQKETSVVFPPKSTTPVAPPIIHIHHPTPDIIKNSVVIQPPTTPLSATWLRPPQAPRGRRVSFSQTDPLQPPVPADGRQAAQAPQPTTFASGTPNLVSGTAPAATSGGPPPRAGPTTQPPPPPRTHRVLTPPVVMPAEPASRAASPIKYLATTNLGRPLVRGLPVRLSPVLQSTTQSPPQQAPQLLRDRPPRLTSSRARSICQTRTPNRHRKPSYGRRQPSQRHHQTHLRSPLVSTTPIKGVLTSTCPRTQRHLQLRTIKRDTIPQFRTITPLPHYMERYRPYLFQGITRSSTRNELISSPGRSRRIW